MTVVREGRGFSPAAGAASPHSRFAARRSDAIPLGPIRSLHYFLPVIEELLHTPLHHGDAYLAYLRSKVPLRPASDDVGAISQNHEQNG